MDLVDRYLNAVRFWLPKDQRRDIIAELSEDLRSQLEERQAALGRPLADAEIEAVLKKSGKPYAVAGRFLPQRSLIGPTLFPAYVFTLKVIGAVYVVPWLLIWAVLAAFVPSFRAAHPGLGLFETLGSLWTSMLTAFAVVTVGFALGERSLGRGAALLDWDPKRLPAVRDVLKIPRSGSAIEIVVDILFLAWWAGGLTFPVAFASDGEPAALGPVPIWTEFRDFAAVPVAVLVVAAACLSAFALVRPYWTRARLALRILIDLVTAALILAFLGPRAGEATDLLATLRAGAGPSRLAAGLGFTAALSLGIVAAICLAASVRNVVRIARYDALRERRPV